MSINIGPADSDDMRPRITVIGVGGAGGNAIANMIDSEIEGVEFVVANTDAQALSSSPAEIRIQLGTDITKGLGAGAKPEVGRAAAEETVKDCEEALEGVNMVFIAAGMGGGTGTGAAPVPLDRSYASLTDPGLRGVSGRGLARVPPLRRATGGASSRSWRRCAVPPSAQCLRPRWASVRAVPPCPCGTSVREGPQSAQNVTSTASEKLYPSPPTSRYQYWKLHVSPLSMNGASAAKLTV